MVEPDYLAAVRESYDSIAGAYAEVVKKPVELDPVSRAVLGAFAEFVRVGERGPVADLGCGPGHVTAHLVELGVPAFGIDLSARMVELARRAHPGVGFTVGSMTALPLPDDGLGGILAYYSTHHTPPEALPTVFAEFHRALAPGGQMMLAGQVGNRERRRPTHAYGGHPVSYESHRLPLERIAELLGRAGLVVTARLEQTVGDTGGGGGGRRVGTCLARKPERGEQAGRMPVGPT
ncbi:class I SAM-dependent methyltransferase [Streptomyces sp. NPDC056149]|uniref:class I SAM-dependent methyltransferase n=1 Tax=Streptomyces sp. NPDC056149 TaxID=3345728 RepID=UPI0035E0F48C